jgi:hypothetical protein
VRKGIFLLFACNINRYISVLYLGYIYIYIYIYICCLYMGVELLKTLLKMLMVTMLCITEVLIGFLYSYMMLSFYVIFDMIKNKISVL